MDAQIKKGILEMCILFLVSKEDIYGYQLIKLLQHYFPEVNQSTFYAILRRLCKGGVTEIYYGKETNGPNRKYYRITEQGKIYLKSLINDWNKLNEIISTIGIKKYNI